MSKPIRLGLLRLCDAAPVILAKHEGLFAEAGLDVVLSIEPSWANIADKLAYDMLDGAVMLPPLAMACAAGLRGRPLALVVPMNLSTEGNSFILSSAHHALYAQGGMARVVAGARLRLAVVHGFSSHDLLLRHWLATQGISPEQDVAITVLPPAEMVGSLAAGAIDGFCAGAPWGFVAAKAGMGFTACHSGDIWPGHPEKCLALQAGFAAAAPERLNTLLRVLMQAQHICADPKTLGKLSALLAQPHYLDLPAELLAEALNVTHGGPGFSVAYPAVEAAQWYAKQMQRWGKGPAGLERLTTQLYRPDLFLQAGGCYEKARVEPPPTK